MLFEYIGTSGLWSRQLGNISNTPSLTIPWMLVTSPSTISPIWLECMHLKLINDTVSVISELSLYEAYRQSKTIK